MLVFKSFRWFIYKIQYLSTDHDIHVRIAFYKMWKTCVIKWIHWIILLSSKNISDCSTNFSAPLLESHDRMKEMDLLICHFLIGFNISVPSIEYISINYPHWHLALNFNVYQIQKKTTWYNLYKCTGIGLTIKTIIKL